MPQTLPTLLLPFSIGAKYTYSNGEPIMDADFNKPRVMKLLANLQRKSIDPPNTGLGFDAPNLSTVHLTHISRILRAESVVPAGDFTTTSMEVSHAEWTLMCLARLIPIAAELYTADHPHETVHACVERFSALTVLFTVVCLAPLHMSPAGRAYITPTQNFRELMYFD